MAAEQIEQRLAATRIVDQQRVDNEARLAQDNQANLDAQAARREKLVEQARLRAAIMEDDRPEVLPPQPQQNIANKNEDLVLNPAGKDNAAKCLKFSGKSVNFWLRFFND